MKKQLTTIVVLFSVLAVVLLVYFLFFSGNENRFQWYESYKADNDQPYGTLFVRKLLEGYKPEGHWTYNDKKPISELLGGEAGSRSANYVFIGQSLNLDDDDANALLKFVGSGNDAFIASLEPPEAVLEKFMLYECGYKVTYLGEPIDSVVLNFYHDTLATANGYRYTYRFRSEDESYSWLHIAGGIFCDSTKGITPLGYQKISGANFVKISHGGGHIYLHCDPIVFTNYFMIQPDKLNYASGVFSHLQGKDMIWDEYSKLPFVGNGNAYNSPLYYIMQQPSLKYAWWLFLVCVVLYVLFAMKRKQRVIPVIEPKTNTTLEFIHQISTLHFKNGNHLDMARKKMKYFLYFIRTKYALLHTSSFKEEQILRLSEKSKVNVEDVRAVFRQYEMIERNSTYNIPDYRLVDLYYAIDNFYKNCK